MTPKELGVKVWVERESQKGIYISCATYEEAKEMEEEQKETYKYTEKDLRKAIDMAKKGNYKTDWVGRIQVTDKYDENEIIKVINQTKQQEQTFKSE